MERTAGGNAHDDRHAPDAARREDLHTFLFATAAVTTAAAVGAAMQGVWAHDVIGVGVGGTAALRLLAANLTGAVVTLLGAVALR